MVLWHRVRTLGRRYVVHAEIAFLKAEQVNGGSEATYAHVPDPTADDPEAGEEQLLCAPPCCEHLCKPPEDASVIQT